MGLLMNQPYWSAQTQKLIKCRPDPRKNMTTEQTAEYLKILCATFTDLTNDKELISDIQTAFAVMGSGLNHPPVESPSFKSFIQVYENSEREWLMQIGIDMDSAADIIEAIRDTYPIAYDHLEDADRIVARIKTASKACCEAENRNASDQEKLERAKEMRGVYSGIVTLSVDIAPPTAAVAVGMPWIAAALGPIAAYSAKSGLQAIVQGTKRWF